MAAVTRLGPGGYPLAAVSFAAPPPVNYVDFAGNLGVQSLYGKLAYGKGQYSRGAAFAPALSGNVDIVGQDFFAGNLAPAVTLAASLGIIEGLAGGLNPVVSFSGSLITGIGDNFAGNLAPVIALAGALSVDTVLAGALAPQVAIAANLSLDAVLGQGAVYVTVGLAGSSVGAGPLWAPSDPCPPPMWTPDEPPDVAWQPSELCNG